MQQAKQAERYRAELAAERLRSIGLLTEVALWQVASLSTMEGNLIKQVPLAESRLGAIVDVAAGAMAAEIARLGMRSS